MAGGAGLEARKLSPRDRLALIAALWDTLSDEDVPVTAEDRALLDTRLADFEARSPLSGSIVRRLSLSERPLPFRNGDRYS